MKSKYDLSHTGAKPINMESKKSNDSTKYDLSKFGASKINQPSSNQNIISALSSGYKNQLFDPVGSTMRITGSNYNPVQTMKEIASPIGKAMMMYNPEISAGRGMLPGLVNMLGRIGSGTASGTLSEAPKLHNTDEVKNALGENAAIGGLMELAPAPFRALRFAAEKMNPKGYAMDIAKSIKNKYDQMKSLVSAHYNPVMNKHGETLHIDPHMFNQTLDDNKDFFTPDVNLWLKQFKKNPTLENAHRLQSIMGDNVRNLSPQKAVNLDKIQAINNSREALKQDLIKGLELADPKAADMYKTGSKLHAEQVVPYESNKTLRKITEGDFDISPSELNNSLSDIEKDKDILNTHHLKNLYPEVNNAVNFGKALQTGIPTGIGISAGLASGALFPGHGIGGAGLGGIGAGALAKYAEPGFIDLVQNPWIEKMLKNASNLYYPAARAEASSR